MHSEYKKARRILRLVEISKLYYEQNLTQIEVAKKLNISRPLVSKLLAEARDLGIVHVEIKSPITTNTELLDQLSDIYNLEGGLIIPTVSRGGKITQQLLISQAALYIEALLPSFKSIGLGWGYTMGCLVDELKPINMEKERRGYVCPIVGNASNEVKYYQINEMTRVFAKKAGKKAQYLLAPAFPTTLENKKLFENTREYQNIYRLWSKLDAVIVGAGLYPSVPDQATAARFGNILKERKAVGMIATYYYDAHGRFIESPNDIVIRIPMEDLRRTKVILIVGSGERRIESVRGALVTGLISHLVIDDGTAKELLE